jgi:hypothetical protein
MIHLTQTTTGNGPVSGTVHDEFLRSVKVVAGGGFEPTTFRCPAPRRWRELGHDLQGATGP